MIIRIISAHIYNIKKLMLSTELKIILILLLIYLYPFISNDILYYNDDISRKIIGYTKWSGDARPFADVFNSIFSYEFSFVAYAHPLPLLISVFALALLIVKYVFCNFSGHRVYIASLFCLLVFNPLFLQNLYFQFDAPFMLLSVAFMFIPFIFSSKHKIQLQLISILAILFSLSSYQASLSIFVFLSCVEAFFNSDIKKKCLLIGSSRILQLLISILIYTTLIKYLPLHEYFISFNQRIPLDKNLLNTLLHNYATSYAYVRKSLGSMLMVPVYLSVVHFIISCYILLRRGRYFTLTISLVSIIAMTIAIPITMVASQHPMLMPRIYIGFSSVIVFMLLTSLYLYPFLYYYSRVVLFVTLLIYTTACYKVTNAIMLHQDYYNSIAKQVNYDLNSIDIENKTVSVIGYPALPERLEKLAQKIPLYEVMKLNYFDGGILIMNGLNKNIVTQYSGKESDLNFVLTSNNYNLIGDNNNLVVKFK